MRGAQPGRAAPHFALCTLHSALGDTIEKMEPVRCVVCRQPVNVLHEHLLSAHFVDAKTGALAVMHFHGGCYLKWRAEHSGRSLPASPALPVSPGATRPAPLPAGPVANPAGGAPAARPPAASPQATVPGPEIDLTPEERERLQRLRGRPAAEREGRSWPGERHAERGAPGETSGPASADGSTR